MRRVARRSERAPPRNKRESWLQDVASNLAPRLSSARASVLRFRIQRGVARLGTLLLEHPEGYRRVLARLEAAARGEEAVYPWLGRRRVFPRDHRQALKALERAEAQAPGAAAWRSLAAGVRILDKRPLEPAAQARH